MAPVPAQPSNPDKLPRVLVVEDHPDTLAVMGKILSRIPADGIPVATCAAARDTAACVPDLCVVIADLHLPDGDGLELLAELKARHGCATVVLSGTDAPTTGIPRWVDLWLTKPTTAQTLRRAVKSLCPDPA
jgi:two-component system CitB family response regulator